MERIFEAGALDVYTAPIGMKKNRPGVLLRAMCAPERRENVAAAIFRHTSTIGLREARMERRVLRRETAARETPLGPVRVKRVSGFGVEREKYEYDDLARIAREQGLSLAQIRQKIEEK